MDKGRILLKGGAEFVETCLMNEYSLIGHKKASPRIKWGLAVIPIKLLYMLGDRFRLIQLLAGV